MCMLVIYEILKYQHWKKLFHLQGNRLGADESWNSIWHKKKKPIVSKLIMNMLAKLRDNYDFNKIGESPAHLDIMSQLVTRILLRRIWTSVKMSSTRNQGPRNKRLQFPTASIPVLGNRNLTLPDLMDHSVSCLCLCRAVQWGGRGGNHLYEFWN